MSGGEADDLALARASGVLTGSAEDPGSPVVAVVGATGLVGQEMLRILDERGFPMAGLKLFASERSRGRPIEFRGKTYEVDVLSEDSFAGIDLVLMEVESPISREWAPIAAAAGATVIDNSSAWRMDDGIPLVVAEVNPEDLKGHKGIIANPNCTTMTLMPVLAPLHREFGIRRAVITSLQSVSGTGQAALRELEKQTLRFSDRPSGLRRAGIDGGYDAGEIYPKPIAFNVIPQCDDFADEVRTKEEVKLVAETHKILADESIGVIATCVRVPVEVGHSLSVVVEFKRPVHVEEALDLLADAPGVDLYAGLEYPTPLDVAGTDDVSVGRIRPDASSEGGLAFWVCGDNLRKGAALNCVQIAEVLLDQGWLKPR